MGFFKNLFTWWEGASLGTSLYSWRHGRKVGEDSLGNVYMEAKKGDRRWVMYKGSNDVSRVPPEWYAWLTRQIDAVPDEALPPPPKFLKTPAPNLTGTPLALIDGTELTLRRTACASALAASAPGCAASEGVMWISVGRWAAGVTEGAGAASCGPEGRPRSRSTAAGEGVQGGSARVAGWPPRRLPT